MKAALTAVALAAAALAGCGSACQDLANRICDCQPAGTLRDNCKSAVKTQLSAQAATDAEQANCQELLGTCRDPTNDAGACDALNTEAGKVACGISF